MSAQDRKDRIEGAVGRWLFEFVDVAGELEHAGTYAEVARLLRDRVRPLGDSLQGVITLCDRWTDEFGQEADQ